MDWESLKYFLAVARTGSLAGAGRTLNVKHTTVLRRIAALEADLGLKLFERHPNGMRLTAAGEEMRASVERIDDEATDLERRLSGRDLRLTGTVRIATLGAMVPWIGEAIASFRRLHPGIDVEVSVSPSPVNLARHETDIAVRVSTHPPESLFGRRIASLAHAVYGVAAFAAAHAAGTPLQDFDWIAYSEARSDLPQARWLAERFPDARVATRTGHTGMMVAAARAGIGLAVLPCYLAEPELALHRIEMLPQLGQDMWLLTHRDLRRTPRVRALMDFLWRDLGRYRGLIEGRVPRDADD